MVLSNQAYEAFKGWRIHNLQHYETLLVKSHHVIEENFPDFLYKSPSCYGYCPLFSVATMKKFSLVSSSSSYIPQLPNENAVATVSKVLLELRHITMLPTIHIANHFAIEGSQIGDV